MGLREVVHFSLNQIVGGAAAVTECRRKMADGG